MPSTRSISHDLLWFPHNRCFRFAYRDPFTSERRFLNCTPERFETAGIVLPSHDIVRKNTDVAKTHATKLRDAFLKSLGAVQPGAVREEPPTISAAVEQFLALRGVCASYEKTLRYIFGELQKAIGDRRVDLIRDEDLKTFERRMARRVSRNSVRNYLKRIGMLLHFCTKKGWIRVDPRATYRLPREEIKDPQPFTRDELARFFEVCRTDGPSRGWGHLAFLGVGLLTLGLRPIEAMHARWEHIDWDERTLWIDRSHGAKEREARRHQPIPLAAMPHFEAHRQASGPIWHGYFGGPLTPRNLDRARKSLAMRMSGFTWYRFRKTFATIIAEAGHDVMIVSRLLRHSLGGRATSMAQRHYIGQEMVRLRAVVDGAFDDVVAQLLANLSTNTPRS